MEKVNLESYKCGACGSTEGFKVLMRGIFKTQLAELIKTPEGNFKATQTLDPQAETSAHNDCFLRALQCNACGERHSVGTWQDVLTYLTNCEKSKDAPTICYYCEEQTVVKATSAKCNSCASSFHYEIGKWIPGPQYEKLSIRAF